MTRNRPGSINLSAVKAYPLPSQYMSQEDLSGLLDAFRASLPEMIERNANEEDFWRAFQGQSDAISRYAMGFNLDYVADRINAMSAEVLSGVFCDRTAGTMHDVGATPALERACIPPDRTSDFPLDHSLETRAGSPDADNVMGLAFSIFPRREPLMD